MKKSSSSHVHIRIPTALKRKAEGLKPETWGDYALSQRAGVTGFPTLVAGPSDEGTYGVVTRGFAPAEQVLDVLHGWLGTGAQASGAH